MQYEIAARAPSASGVQIFMIAAAIASLTLAAPAAYGSAKKVESHRQASAEKKSDAQKRKGAGKSTYRPSSSEETRAERERRLYRECRGMPNAGACKGFTQR